MEGTRTLTKHRDDILGPLRPAGEDGVLGETYTDGDFGYYHGAMVGRPWSETEQAHIAAHYAAIKNQALSQILDGRTDHAIRNKACRMGIKKSPERMQELGRENFARKAIET